jgi:hypothetical protein
MNCIVCGGVGRAYFNKAYTEPPFDEYMRSIGPVQYERCDACGFVFSRTHRELDLRTWQTLNERFHCHIHSLPPGTHGNQPPYAEQAMMLRLLSSNGLIDGSDMLDYAAGFGTLSRLLQRYFGMDLPLHDPYVKSAGAGRYVGSEDLRQYGTVVNSAMFEHVRDRDDLDRVHALVRPVDGCMVVHTVVCERVPADPDWFYLRAPVHTAFHTNRSMQLLMDQWGYAGSFYCVPAKCWVLLQVLPDDIDDKVRALNDELQANWFHFKRGFVDYWKGF